MRNRSTYCSVLLIVILASFTLAIRSTSALAIRSASADEPCNPSKVSFPDPRTEALSDGEHVIGAADTRNGRFEVRVTVKNKVASKPQLFIGGRLMRPVPEAQIPKDVRDCLKKAQGATATTSGNIAENAKAASIGADRLGATAGPKVFCFAVATCGKALNGKFYCFGVVCCDRGGCEDFYGLE